MGMFGPKEGVAYITSKKDQRWDCSIECLVGGLVMPEQLERIIERKEMELGPKPDDLEWGYYKY